MRTLFSIALLVTLACQAEASPRVHRDNGLSLGHSGSQKVQAHTRKLQVNEEHDWDDAIEFGSQRRLSEARHHQPHHKTLEEGSPEQATPQNLRRQQPRMIHKA
eukprot:Blabericola_migrator_1__7023@NODE_355_length_9465_cov_113_241434_g284_i0_p6_GENE_NODE_355_length_9465_cov_113_241434_g284_i0NODE_355_length_9465_cov_113_241434_g284_i0_p6_ORF_typecomplete_len104_score20_20Apelin/PF15360_6/9_5e03Apelin/PF15360_6/0_25SWISNF_Ssr4/PF08549_10/0_2SWISNF_Ssr4/PF08549_10/3_2e03_NODE_355_length_9465_cov_113_241434_g284_i038984209